MSTPAAINLALLLDRSCHERLVFLSQLIAPQCGDDGILLNPETGPFPHCTLIQAHIHGHHYAEAWERTLNLYRRGPAPNLEFTQVQAHGAYIFAMLRPTPELLDLHLDEALIVAGLRSCDMEHPTTDDLTPEQEESVRELGWTYGILAYQPHVTIGYCQDAMTAKRVVSNLKGDADLHGLVCAKPRLALGTVGPHGTIVSLLQESPAFHPRIALAS